MRQRTGLTVAGNAFVLNSNSFRIWNGLLFVFITN